MNYLASNFKLLRENLGLNQVQISVSLGFNRTTWNNYETGKSKPSLDDFIKITKYFGYSASDLLEKDLTKLDLSKNPASKKNTENLNPKLDLSLDLKSKKEGNIKEGESIYHTIKGTDQLILEHLINLTNVVNKLAKTIENKGI